MRLFSKKPPPPRNQLMVNPNTWIGLLSSYIIPAVNGTQLSVNEITRIFEPWIHNWKTASVPPLRSAPLIPTARQETEFYSLSVEF